MARLTMYTATCWREGTSWTVHVAQLDRTTSADRLSEVDAAARGLIARTTGVDPDAVEVVVDLRVPDEITRVLGATAAVRPDPDVISMETVSLRRSLARQLTDHGYDVQDITVSPGVSYPPAKLRAPELGVGQLGVDQLGVDGLRVGDSRVAAGFSAPAVVRPHSGYQHEAFLYHGDDEFLAGTVSFIRDAVALNQPIMVALAEPRLRLIEAALGPHDGDVQFVDLGELGANPARIVPAWLDFIRRNADQPVRGISESQWPGRRPEEVVECQLHEGLLNVAIDPDLPLWLRCPYDVSRLPESIADAALDSHPTLVDADGHHGSTSYGGLHHVESIFRSELPPAPSDCDLLRFGKSDLTLVRDQVNGAAQRAGLSSDRCRALLSAVEEIAINSIRNGGGRAELRTWTRDDALVCQVNDRVELSDPLVGARRPVTRELEERGLWLANQVSDLVQVRSAQQGSTTRVFAWL
ncbi:MAG TPA: sensor histidine kinase [Kineosporiaceae bacterium]|nr:sensor histidine kinase [Kineosporiaceae bacterium]